MIPIQLPPNTIEGPRGGTDEWKEARRGLVTASRFGDVMTEPRSKAAKDAGQMSDTARGYLMELVASEITGEDKVGGRSAAMDRGVDKEADAIDAYAAQRFITVAEGRLLLRPMERIAATPDGFVEEDDEGHGIIEVKCPESKRHLQTWLDRTLPEEYVEQVLGQLWISGRAWCDFISFDDRFPRPMQTVVIRVRAADHLEEIAALEEKVCAYARKMREQVASIRAFLAECSPQEARTVTEALHDSLEDVVSRPEAQE